MEPTLEGRDDPRLAPEYVRTIGSDDARVVLVGVVHDHPASVYRAASVVESVDPAVVAVELPPLALPLFERRAREGAETVGSEMTAALAAGENARHVAIDGFGRSFLRSLVRAARKERASLATLRRTVSNVLDVAGSAVACRVAALPWVDAGDDATFEYDVSASAPPERLAADERRRVSSRRSLLRAVERPHADRLVDDAREASMAARLATLRESGPVVAVVGCEHVDGVASALEPTGRSEPNEPAPTARDEVVTRIGL